MLSTNEKISELIELNEELENYFSNTIIPQLFVDANLRLRKFTPPAMKQFTLKEEFIGKPFEEFIDNFRYPTIIENISAVIESGEILEKEIQTTDMKWYQMNILPYHIKSKNITNGVIVTFVDITLRIRDLKEQEKMIAEHELLLDTIAHDIQNPINCLGLSIELIKRLSNEQMEKFPRLLNNLEGSLENMKDVVNGLSETRFSRNTYNATDELIDLENIIEDVRLTLSFQILERNAKITLELHDTQLYFARRKLRSALFNLINNAIKYTPLDKTPEIIITSKVEHEDFIICVKDNGIGISEEHQETIFKKFERLNPDIEGTGVGLYLINSIVTSAGGSVTVSSEVGKGSSFEIKLKDALKQPQS
ncbi:ATP-binding protein [Pedobacter lithocola]|uniref:histidine kinase n=1 Tax=Pedobacter lithocola TaxID=1908239 RepID=A0ABV8P820_9SPHI